MLVDTEVDMLVVKLEVVEGSDALVSVVDVVTLAGVLAALDELGSVKVLNTLDVDVRVISGASPTVVKASKDPSLDQICHLKGPGNRNLPGRANQLSIFEQFLSVQSVLILLTQKNTFGAGCSHFPSWLRFDVFSSYGASPRTQKLGQYGDFQVWSEQLPRAKRLVSSDPITSCVFWHTRLLRHTYPGGQQVEAWSLSWHAMSPTVVEPSKL